MRGLQERWGDFKRALRYADQSAFERLFEHARAHADAGGYLNHEEPLFPILVSVDLEQEKRLSALEERLETLEAELESEPGCDTGADPDTGPVDAPTTDSAPDDA